MTDRVSSSPEPNYPWTRYHWSEEQTTCDPDHWNTSNRSRSTSEERDPNDDPFTGRTYRDSPHPIQVLVTRHTHIDADANQLVENDIPLPTRPCIATEDLRITEQPPRYNQFLHGQQRGPQPAIFLLQNWLLS